LGIPFAEAQRSPADVEDGYLRHQAGLPADGQHLRRHLVVGRPGDQDTTIAPGERWRERRPVEVRMVSWRGYEIEPPQILPEAMIPGAAAAMPWVDVANLAGEPARQGCGEREWLLHRYCGRLRRQAHGVTCREGGKIAASAGSGEERRPIGVTKTIF